MIELENSIVSQNVQGVSGYRVTMKNSFVTQNVQGVSGDQVMVEHSIVAGNLRGLSCSHCALVNTTFEFNRQYGAEVLTGYVNESIARNNSVGYSTKSTFSITRNTIEDNDIGVSAGSYVTFLTKQHRPSKPHWDLRFRFEGNEWKSNHRQSRGRRVTVRQRNLLHEQHNQREPCLSVRQW